MQDLDLYNAYIKAWSNYEEDNLMNMLTKYLDKELMYSDNWSDLKYFHKYYSIKSGHYYGVDSNYAIGCDGEVVWEGDYPSAEIIQETVNGD